MGEKLNARLMDIAEKYVVEEKRNKEIRAEYQEVLSAGEKLFGIDEILQDSDERLVGYRAWVKILNRSEQEFMEAVQRVEEFMEGYKERKTGTVKNTWTKKWTEEDIKREIKRRADAGMSLNISRLQKVDYGFAMAVYRKFKGVIDERFREAIGMTPKEYEAKRRGTKPEDTLTVKRKFMLIEKPKKEVPSESKLTLDVVVEILDKRRKQGESNELDALRDYFGVQKLRHAGKMASSFGKLLELLYGEETVKAYDKVNVGWSVYKVYVQKS